MSKSGAPVALQPRGARRHALMARIAALKDRSKHWHHIAHISRHTPGTKARRKAKRARRGGRG